ncbi:type I-F CRISPR-associated endoribonuclease Cas6/Csy4 [Morganella morganii]|uniref:type I-F CRISPR-associated endoribonuclease Cas6/Csy4 n=1 Tax=Morganella morganii TaxID=582 RepID=UPI0034D4FF05
MRFYQTITILPDVLISAVFLRQQIWQQLHLILAENKTDENSSAVAVAFPDYCRKSQTPGNRLRLLAGDYPSLAELGLSVRLSAFYPYIRLSGILPVPEKTLPVSYIREHVKGLRRSQAACAGRLFIPETLPFIWTQSLSGGRHHRPFPFFIRKLDAKSAAEGRFTCYGLSQKRTENGRVATVPHF